jgi:uncharacterized RDD family membrane protein YckC
VSGDPLATHALASVGARVGAWFIDEFVLLAIFIACLLAATAVSDASNAAATAFIVVGIGAWFWLPVWWASGRGGESPGKRSLRIQVIGADGEPIGLVRSTLRRFVLLLGGLFLYIGWLAGLRDPRRRTWHDQAAHSLVVARRAAPKQPQLSPQPTAIGQPALATPGSCPVCGFAIGADGRCTVCGARA